MLLVDFVRRLLLLLRTALIILVPILQGVAFGADEHALLEAADYLGLAARLPWELFTHGE